jgi:hypothetical protein
MAEDLVLQLKALPLFKDLDDNGLEMVSRLVEPAFFGKDTIVFKQGDEGDNFYVIKGGKVLVKVSDEAGAEAELSRFGAGDFFGEAGLLKDEPRNATVIALADTHLYAFTRQNFKILIEYFPRIKEQVIKQAKVRTGGGQVRFPWQLPDEITLFASSRHAYSLVRSINGVLPTSVLIGVLIFLAFRLPNLAPLLMGLAGAATVFLALLIAWYVADWRNDYFVVTDRRVVHIERVLFVSESRNEAPIEAIEDVLLIQPGPVAGWLNFATIRVRMAGGGGFIEFTYLPNAEAAKQHIFQQRALAQGEIGQERTTAIRYAIEKAILPPGAPPPPPPPEARRLEPPVPIKMPPPTVWQQLGENVQMRIQREGQIIWRKHWLVLLAQLFKPMLVLGLGIFVIAVVPIALAQLAGWLALFLGIGWFFWEWADWENDLYILTPANIIDIDRLPLKLREHRREGGLDRIQDIQVILPTFWANVFNIGNVRIKTAAADGDFTFDSVYDPRGVQRDVFHQLAVYRRKKDQLARQREFETMAQWFAIYNQVTTQPKAAPPQPGSTS